jgi:hypothetical protein
MATEGHLQRLKLNVIAVYAGDSLPQKRPRSWIVQVLHENEDTTHAVRVRYWGTSMTGESSPGQGSSIAENFSLARGGPFDRALQRIGLGEPRVHVKRIVAWLMLTWLPLVLLSFVQGTAWGDKVRIPLLHDYSIYCRFLVAVPLLIVAEAVIDPFLRRAVSTFNSSGIIKQADLPSYHAALEKITLLRNSGLVEFLLALLAGIPYFLLVAAAQWAFSRLSTWHGTTSEGLSPAGWWFTFVASPILRFLVFRWFWRYALWIYLLRAVSKLELHLLPTHPDRLGGLGFLLFAHQHFAILSAALGSVLAGQFADEIIYFGKTVEALRAPTILFIVISVLMILLPLTLFSPKLVKLRNDGLVRYGVVGMSVAGRFDTKWVESHESPPQEMIGSQDPSSLIDYIGSYDALRQTQVILIDKRSLVYILFLSAAPFLFVWLLTTPVDKWVGEILKRLL